MNILIVEDEYQIAENIAELVQLWGHICDISHTGQSALKKFQENNFELILLDIFLPDTSAHYLISRFKEIKPQIDIITITGHSSKKLEQEIREKGIIYFMSKPFSQKELKIILDHLSLRNSSTREAFSDRHFEALDRETENCHESSRKSSQVTGIEIS